MDLVTALLVGVPQVAVFAMVPFAWWLNAGRPEGSFAGWLGFRPPKDAGAPLVVAATIIAGLGFFGGGLLSRSTAAPAGQVGYFAVLALAFVAVVATALSEELFFRGFLLRWLGEKRTGTLVANLFQALCCGLLWLAVHWLFISRELWPCLAAFALGVGPALIVGWLRQRTQSLLLPWAAHGLGNLVAALVGLLAR